MTIRSRTWMKVASWPSMRLETILYACMMSPPSRRRSLTHSSTSFGRYFLATLGKTPNRVAKPFVRTLRTALLRVPTRLGATSSYCGSAINGLYIMVKVPRRDLQSSSLFVCDEEYLGGFPSCSSVRLYKILTWRSCDRSVRCRSMFTYGFRRLWILRWKYPHCLSMGKAHVVQHGPIHLIWSGMWRRACIVSGHAGSRSGSCW